MRRQHHDVQRRQTAHRPQLRHESVPLGQRRAFKKWRGFRWVRRRRRRPDRRRQAQPPLARVATKRMKGRWRRRPTCSHFALPWLSGVNRLSTPHNLARTNPVLR
jgi:hypothetical protein